MKRIQANVALRDKRLIEMRWSAPNRRAALKTAEHFYKMMPIGYREESTNHRTRIGRGQRRSCTMILRYFDKTKQRLTPEEISDHFTEAMKTLLVEVEKK